MADPLTEAANSLATPPAASNYFDPAPGRDVIARYGQSRALGDTLQGALRLSGLARQERLGQVREPVAAMQAQEYVAGAPLRARQQEFAMDDLDMKELELADQREFRAKRGELIKGLSQLDGTSPDFPVAYRNFLSEANPSVLEDPVVKDLLDIAQADYKETQMRDRYKEQEELRRQRYRENSLRRVQEKAGGKGIDSERERAIYEANIGDDGVFDEVGYNMDLLSEATGTERKADIEDYEKKVAIRTRAGKAFSTQKEVEEAAQRSVNVDTEAFPRHMDALRKSAQETSWGQGLTGKNLDEQIEMNWPEEMRNAERWDDAPYDNEIESALGMTRDDYVNFYPDLPEAKKEKRDIVWLAAHGVGPEQDTASQAVPAKRVDMPGFESEAEQAAAAATPTQEDIQRARQIAGGDREKFIQALKDMGY